MNFLWGRPRGRKITILSLICFSFTCLLLCLASCVIIIILGNHCLLQPSALMYICKIKYEWHTSVIIKMQKHQIHKCLVSKMLSYLCLQHLNLIHHPNVFTSGGVVHMAISMCITIIMHSARCTLAATSHWHSLQTLCNERKNCEMK